MIVYGLWEYSSRNPYPDGALLSLHATEALALTRGRKHPGIVWNGLLGTPLKWCKYTLQIKPIHVEDDLTDHE